MRVLSSHGTPTTSLHNISRAIVVSRIQYAAPAWSGMSSATDRARLDPLLRRGKRLGYCSNDVPTVAELFNSADHDFFYSVKTDFAHVFQPYLPDQTHIPYRLRTWPMHSMTMINKNQFLDDIDLIIRMLYKYSY